MQRIEISQDEMNDVRKNMFLQSTILTMFAAEEKYNPGSIAHKCMRERLQKCRSVMNNFASKYKLVSDTGNVAYV